MKIFKLLLINIAVLIAVFLVGCNDSSNVNQGSFIENTNAILDTTEDEIVNNETKTETIGEMMLFDEVSKQDNEIEKDIEKINETKETELVNTMTSNNILVAYFSATGTTKRVAEKIAELTDADIYEIVPLNQYSAADLDWHDNNSRSTKEMNDKNVRPEIGSDDIDISSYDTIYLGYPIWWGDAPRIMATFVEKYNFDGKKVIPFCTSGGSGIGRSGTNLGTLAGSGNFVNGERLNSSADTNNIQNFINNNK